MCTGAMKICRQLQVTCCDHARPQQDKRNRQWLSKYWQSMYARYPGFHRLIGGCFLNCHSKRGRHQGSRGWTVEARKNNQYEFLVSILTGFKCCPVLWCLISYVVRIKCTPAPRTCGSSALHHPLVQLSEKSGHTQASRNCEESSLIRSIFHEFLVKYLEL